MQLVSSRSLSHRPLRGGRAARVTAAAAPTLPATHTEPASQLQIRDDAIRRRTRDALSGAAAALVATAILACGPQPAWAVGLESVDLPNAPDMGEAWARIADGSKQKIADADDAFEKSDTLKRLLQQSEDNKSKNKKQIQDKYCYRQAELGIGDCGGLRYIPGMTENGKQQTPQWLADLLGVEVPEQSPELKGKTLKDLFDGQDFQ